MSCDILLNVPLLLKMLPQSWEPIATELAQCPDDQVSDILQRILDEHAKAPPAASKASVLVGYDTRPSASTLLEAAKAGVAALGLEVHDAGEILLPGRGTSGIECGEIKTSDK